MVTKETLEIEESTKRIQGVNQNYPRGEHSIQREGFEESKPH